MNMPYCFLLVSAVCFAQAPEPRITFDKIHHDFGRVSLGRSVSHKFVITNRGDAPLHIKEVRESCNCTRAAMPKPRLAPGESTFVEVNFNSIGMKGNVQKSIELISNDPINPKTLLTFEASVVNEIMPSKSVVIFNDVSRHDSASENIRLKSGNDSPVSLKEIKLPAAYLSCKAQKEGNDVILDVKIDGRLIPKDKSKGMETLTVHTSNDKFPTMRFTVQWDTLPEIICSQKRIAWDGAAGKEMRTTITLKHSGGKAFKVLGAKSTSPYIKVANLSKNSAEEHQIEVIMTADAKVGMYYEKVFLRLNDKNQKEAEIAISAVLR
jgi:hypothetical protein